MHDPKYLLRLSKFLSFILRHQPEHIGLQLDAEGWADVEELLEKSRAHGMELDRPLLLHLIATNPKQRFARHPTHDRIRASQGHSTHIQLGYPALQPPTLLYHGTAQRFVDSIMATGLERRNRHHVHLSGDPHTATQVGQRHGKPFVFEVLAAEMQAAGFVFFRSANGVWLTEHVPPAFLRPHNP